MSVPTRGRRRFLQVAGSVLAAAALPASAPTEPTVRWRGRALGAEVEITLRGPEKPARRALEGSREVLRRMESLFSLYDPASALSRLNRSGRLDRPDAAFLDLLRQADAVVRATGGAFDPSVQPLWRLLAASGGAPDPAALRHATALVGWEAVGFDESAVRLERSGMALTFNGIAQGFATDRVSEALHREGFFHTLVNVGEFRAGGGVWRIGVEDPALGLVAVRPLTRGAFATSSPAALWLKAGEIAHILSPREPTRRARWSTVSVEAATAAQADGYSTAFTMIEEPAVRGILAEVPGLTRALLVAEDGTVRERGLPVGRGEA